MRKHMSVLLAAVLVTSALPTPAFAAPGADPVLAVTVSPTTAWPSAPPCTSGTGENKFTVSGTGFKPDERIDLSVGGVGYDSLRAGADGGYSATRKVRSLPSGPYPVVLDGDQGSLAATTITLGYSACRSIWKGKLRLTGAGYAATDTITLSLDGTEVKTAESTADGRFDMSVKCAAGEHDARVVGAGDRELEFTTFTC